MLAYTRFRMSGFCVVPCTGNGNCLFNTISMFANSTEAYASTLRRIAVERVREEFVEFCEYMDFPQHISMLNNTMRMAWYTQHMLTDGVWASNLVEGEALARVLRVRISFLNHRNELVHHSTMSYDIVITIRFVNNNHFELMLPLSNDACLQRQRMCVETSINQIGSSYGYAGEACYAHVHRKRNKQHKRKDMYCRWKT